jgi:hypothetical protein
VGCTRGTWREGSCIGDPEGFIKNALEMSVFLHRDPIDLPGNLKERRDFDLSGGLVY